MSFELGFVEPQRIQRIYIGSEGSSKWYTWDQDKQIANPLPTNSLNCYIKAVNCEAVTSDYGVSNKLKVLVQADKNYEIFVGLETWFAKTLLVSIAAIPAFALTQPVNITVVSTDQKNKVFFARLSDLQGCPFKSNHIWKDDQGKAIPVEVLDLVSDISQRLEQLEVAIEPPLIEPSEIDATEENLTAYTPTIAASVVDNLDIPF